MKDSLGDVRLGAAFAIPVVILAFCQCISHRQNALIHDSSFISEIFARN
jgi:hypothetical protein